MSGQRGLSELEGTARLGEAKLGVGMARLGGARLDLCTARLGG